MTERQLVDADRADGDTRASDEIAGADRESASGRWHYALWFCAIMWSGLGTWLLLSESVPNSPGAISPSLAHATLFFWVSVSAAALVIRTSTRTKVATVFAVCAAAGISEILQAQISRTRQGSFADFGIDLVGITGGVVALAVARTLFRTPRGVETIAAASSLTALVALGGMLGASSPQAERWWDCRGQQTDFGNHPLIELEDERVLAPAGSPATISPVVLDDSLQLACSVAASQELTVIVEFTSADQTQEGPTRIVSSSVGIAGNQVNMHVGQTGDGLSIRLRNSSTNSRHWIKVPGVIEAGSRQQFALVFADASVDVFADGILVGSFAIEDFSLDGWISEFPILVGDELSLDRTFVGDIHSIRLYNRIVSEAELVVE